MSQYGSGGAIAFVAIIAAVTCIAIWHFSPCTFCSEGFLTRSCAKKTLESACKGQKEIIAVVDTGERFTKLGDLQTTVVTYEFKNVGGAATVDTFRSISVFSYNTHHTDGSQKSAEWETSCE